MCVVIGLSEMLSQVAEGEENQAASSGVCRHCAEAVKSRGNTCARGVLLVRACTVVFGSTRKNDLGRPELWEELVCLGWMDCFCCHKRLLEDVKERN